MLTVAHRDRLRGILSISVAIRTSIVVGLMGCSPAGDNSRPTNQHVANSSQMIPDTRPNQRDLISQSPPADPLNFPKFSDVAEERNLQFVYDNGETGAALMVESIGGGAAWLDYDQDGVLDLYLCQGGNPVADSTESNPTDALFRQTNFGQFRLVSQEAVIDERQYSVGVAAADFNDDGFDDLYVTNVGPNTLFANQGDGTFRDISSSAGVGNPLWSASAAWGDLDGDGDLDLYVCNYVDYDPWHPIPCPRPNGKPGTCNPSVLQPVPDECYFNNGDGTFLAEAKLRGLFGEGNKGLGVVIADLNNDGLPDIYIANDTTANFLFINQGRGQFKESAQLLGCAVSREGSPQASMGIALGDYDHNGWLDLYCTHFTYESNTLYKNLGPVGFQDVTGIVGLHAPTLMKLGFGTIMTDFNQDGREDIFVTNGHIDDWENIGEDRRMTPQLFTYQGRVFLECSSNAGPFFSRKSLGRGVACGDFDNDGDWDLAVVHQNSPAAILRNDSDRGHWLKLRFVANGNRRGIGTRVELRQGNRKLVQELAGGVSFCSAHESVLIFGLGDVAEVCELNIRWPDGFQQTIKDVTVDQIHCFRQPRAVSE